VGACQNILTALQKVEAAIVLIAYFIIAMLLLADVLLRELFGTSISGAQRVSVFFMIISGFVGLGLATDRGSHLRPRFADGLIPRSHTKLAERVGTFIMTAVFFYFSWLGITFVQATYEFGEKARTINVPLWMIQMVVPYAFFSVGLRYLFYTIWPSLNSSAEKSS